MDFNRPIALLPKEHWKLRQVGPDQVVAGIYEYPANTIRKVLVKLSDLPNDLIVNDDLIRFGINAVKV